VCPQSDPDWCFWKFSTNYCHNKYSGLLWFCCWRLYM